MANPASARRSQLARSFEQALDLHRQGRRGEAERLYNTILAVDPTHADALHLSGVLRHQQGQSAEGLRLVAAALKRQPRSRDVLSSYGVILDALERHEEALASFEKVLAMRGNDAVAHYNRGNALRGLGRDTEALASYDRALMLAPGLTDAHFNRANTLAALDRLGEALISYETALAAVPDRPDILTNYGKALLKLDRLDDALASFGKALIGDPENVLALTSLGSALVRLKRSDEALANFERAWKLAPDNVLVLISLGNVLIGLKRPDEALVNFERALALAPDHAEALAGYGTALGALGRFDEALASFDRSLGIEPKAIMTHINRGNVFLSLTRMDEALACYSEAIAVDPENPEAHFNAALVRLCLGDFRQGWKEYEYRWKNPQFATLRSDLLQWRGEQDLDGKTIFLIAEQGLGDVIQFVRYAPLVAARGAKVLVGVQSALTALVATVPGVSRALGEGEAVPDFDLCCPLLSLPLAFGTELTTIPAKVPYIRPYEERVAKWRDRLPDSERLRVGVCWSGTNRHSNNKQRSLTLDRFATILSVPGVDFVSLQKEIEQSETAILRDHGVAELGQEFQDFSDTAAVVSMLDLVVSVDTSVAHLAGAMAKAAAVLIPFSPDFRWLLDRTDSPWYPTMRLFRQTAIGDWAGPLDRLRQELSAVAAARQFRATGPG